MTENPVETPVPEPLFPEEKAILAEIPTKETTEGARPFTKALASLKIEPQDLKILERDLFAWEEDDENVSEEELHRRIEVLLFHWHEPLSLQKIKECVLFSGSNQEFRQVLLRYQQKILAQNHSFELLEAANGFIFKSKTQYSLFIRRLTKAHLPFRPSQAVLETLAIVAYKQPIKRSTLENIRGVKSSPILGALLEKNLIQEVGRAKGPGNPKLYGTTEAFLQLFGLKTIEELPRPQQKL
ncbi:MAG: SMC-Scp complex subunit ScpB [Planctomycetota bacterium]